MADLEALVRVRKHLVEQKQKFLAELYRQSEELAQQKINLEQQFEEEREKMNEVSDILGMGSMNYFGAYSDAVADRVEEIEDQMVKLDKRIDVARDDMNRAFAEFKKIEITARRRAEEEQKKLDKKDSDELDEIAIEGHRRKTVE